MNLRIMTKNHVADSKIGSPLKIDFRADLTHKSIPTALKLNTTVISTVCQINQSQNFSNYSLNLCFFVWNDQSSALGVLKILANFLYWITQFLNLRQ